MGEMRGAVAGAIWFGGEAKNVERKPYTKAEPTNENE